jgi:hypothetical protein
LRVHLGEKWSDMLLKREWGSMPNGCELAERPVAAEIGRERL